MGGEGERERKEWRDREGVWADRAAAFPSGLHPLFILERKGDGRKGEMDAKGTRGGRREVSGDG
jgi:hypothetical protein